MSATAPAEPSPRRHDLDALRAVAMLLGIALHAALSFMPGVWSVQDSQAHPGFALFTSAIHGFRMPLFFLVSGFFTAMLWRRRGLKALVGHRFKRIFLPCVIGVFTLVPAVWLSIGVAALPRGVAKKPDAAAASADVRGTDFWSAVTGGNADGVERHLASGAAVNVLHPEWGATPLSLAALYGRTEVARSLIEHGANVNAANRDGGRALHAAAFLGRAQIVKLLLDAGARADVRNRRGQTPAETLTTDWRTTQFIASILKLKLQQKEVEQGRVEAAALFRQHGVSVPDITATAGRGTLGGLAMLLMVLPVFHHLWFLWMLCWLVAGFALCAWVAGRLNWRGPPAWLTLSPARYLWLVPLTMIPQWFMGSLVPHFGPDTSAGLLPMPHVLAYYAIFFAFGALYFDSNDDEGRLGRRWAITLPLMLLVVFPVGLALTGAPGIRARAADAEVWRLVSAAVQVTYAWAMSFAFIGLFRRIVPRESRTLRYVSDSSYWLYLAHLPLVIVAQALVRDWPLPGLVKFLLICVVVTGVLLFTYQYMVRYTWIGALLNGRRRKAVNPPPLPEPEPTLQTQEVTVRSDA